MKIYITLLIIVILSLVVGVYFYPKMPERMVSHWSAGGEPNGYLPKILGVLLVPSILVLLLLLCAVIPKIDPLNKNIQKFREYYDGFFVLLFVFLLLVHSQMILWNAGIEVSFSLTLPVLFGILFFYIGILLEKAKRNWFVGIRTPWTLSDERVWNKTHKIGGKLFKISGIISLFGIVGGEYSVFFVTAPVVFSSLYVVIYSYLEYRKIHSDHLK